MARSATISPRLLVILGAGAGLAALASPASAQDLGRCLAIPDVNQRVQCYDTIARAQQASGAAAPAVPSAAPGAAAAPAVPVAAATPPAADTRQDFGLSAAQRDARLPEAQRQLEEISVTVASARAVGPGYWQLGMTDGSVWRVEEVLRSFRPPRSGDQVSIVRGALGAYYLDADRQPRVRIKRVS